MGTGLFFQSDGDRLYGFLHPATGAVVRPTGVVFVHGAFEERQDAHLILRDAAARLAAQGFACLRFDLYGHGDSEGEFEHASLTRWAADTRAACAELRARTGCERVALVGLRAGALVAARAARAMTGAAAPACVALWQPVTAGRAYALDTLRAHLASEMVTHRRGGGSRDALIAALEAGEPVNVFGYRFGPALFRELCAADLAADLAALPPATRVLLVDVVRTATARGASELDAIAAALGDGRAALARVVEAQPLHAEGKLFVNRADAVFAATARLLEAGDEAGAAP